MKPLRSLLFVPGNQPGRIEKALSLNADAVIIDLEDSVPLEEKNSAREIARTSIPGHKDKRIFVRINSLATPYARDDLKAVIRDGLEGIMLPKMERPSDLRETDRLITALEKKNRLKTGSMEIIGLCETALGLQEIYGILKAKSKNRRISAAALGGADYTLDLGIELTREALELQYPRSLLPAASRAAGIDPPIDSPWMTGIKDIEGLTADAGRARALGFQGKLAIHPDQVEPINMIFTPSDEEIEKAKEIIQAFKKAGEQGKAAVQLQGKFIDYPVAERARRVLELCRAIGKL